MLMRTTAVCMNTAAMCEQPHTFSLFHRHSRPALLHLLLHVLCVLLLCILLLHMLRSTSTAPHFLCMLLPTPTLTRPALPPHPQPPQTPPQPTTLLTTIRSPTPTPTRTRA